MKRFRLSLYLFLFAATLSGQSLDSLNSQTFTQNTHSKGDASVSLSPNILINEPNGAQLAGGLKLRVFISKRISFDADFVVGRHYTHSDWMGLLGLPFWYLYYKGADHSYQGQASDLIFIFVMLLSGGHTAYHFPVKNFVDISPYVSILKIRDYKPWDGGKLEGSSGACTIGLEINKYFKRFMLSPYAEYLYGYSDHLAGFNAGIYCGIYFPRKLWKSQAMKVSPSNFN